jgi:phage/plasmid-like protein (TIGR03299 family)
MAHNIATDSKTGEKCFFGVQAAWHKLGQIVEGALTWEQAMKKAHLDWEVVKEQLISPFDKELIPAWGIFREDTKHFIGTVGSGYEPIQNKYAFDFVDAILEVENGAHYVTAGALGEGEKIWCLAKVNGQMRIGKTDDVSDTYLLFTTSHDGSLSAQSKITTTRVVCQNTLNIALRGAGASMKVKHTRNAQDRLEAAKALMKGVNVQIKDIEAKFNELAVRKVTKESFVDVMTKLFGNWTENERAKNKVLEVAGKIDYVNQTVTVGFHNGDVYISYVVNVNRDGLTLEMYLRQMMMIMHCFDVSTLYFTED